MKNKDNKQDKALGALVAALEHNADRLEEESQNAGEQSQRRCLSATARYASSLSEEIAALALISGHTPQKRDPHDGTDTIPVHVDIKRAFRLCLDSVALGPIRDHIVRGYLNLCKIMAKFESNEEQEEQDWVWGRNNERH